jgi:hypothetical protein
MIRSIRSFPILAVLAVTLLLPLAGCDLFGKDDEAIEGVFVSRGDDVIFLSFTKDKVTEYDYMGDAFDNIEDCYLIGVLDIVERDGDKFTISAEDLPDVQLVVTIRRNGDTLTFTLLGDSETYDSSDRAVASFTPECDWDLKKPRTSLVQRLLAERS